MIAILTRLDKNCQPIKTAGNDPENRRLTNPYKTFARLYRYAIRPALKEWDGRLTAQIWSGERLEGESDRVMTWNTRIFK